MKAKYCNLLTLAKIKNVNIWAGEEGWSGWGEEGLTDAKVLERLGFSPDDEVIWHEYHSCSECGALVNGEDDFCEDHPSAIIRSHLGIK